MPKGMGYGVRKVIAKKGTPKPIQKLIKQQGKARKTASQQALKAIATMPNKIPRKK